MPKSAAGQIWPNLAQGTPEPVQQRTPTVSDALWPGLSRAAKAQEADQRLWDQICRRQWDDFRRGWREANAKGRR
jgi:hypothetical protein